MRINYLLGLPTFLMVIGLAWASHSHAGWEQAYNELDYGPDLPEVDSLLPEESGRSSFDLGTPSKSKGAGSVPDQTTLELMKQLDALQHEVQELRGRLDTQDHELKLLKKEQLNMIQKSYPETAPKSSSSNSVNGLELNSSGITYKPVQNSEK